MTRMRLKYVIYEWGGMELPIVFSSYLSHGDVLFNGGEKAKSAGYCELDTVGRWAVSGQSVTLKLDARPQDAMILNTQMGCRANARHYRLEAK